MGKNNFGLIKTEIPLPDCYCYFFLPSRNKDFKYVFFLQSLNTLNQEYILSVLRTKTFGSDLKNFFKLKSTMNCPYIQEQ